MNRLATHDLPCRTIQNRRVCRVAATTVLLSVFAIFATPGYSQSRFSGNGALSPIKTQTSEDQRFVASAELKGAATSAQTSASGRFSVIANLAVPKSLAATCGALNDLIFKNGFEN